MSGPVVGVIGVGILGRPVAEELLAGGFEVIVRDVDPTAVRGLPEQGATVAASAAEVGERCAVVLVLVQTEDQCRQVVDEVVAAATPSTTVAVMATITPEVVEELAATAAAAGVDLVDAPFAGQGVDSVRSHSMSVLAGGPEEVVERLRPIVEPQLGRLVPAGPLGAGAAVKLAHNVMVYLGYLSVVEAVELARAAGVTDGLVAEVTRASGTLSSQSEVFLEIYERRRLDRGTEAESATFRTYAALLDKDLRHAVELGAAHGVDLPAARLMSTRGAATYVVDQAPPAAATRAVAVAGTTVEPPPVALPPEAVALFEGRPVAFVTTMRPDGRMSTNPMAVVLGDDGLIRLSTVTSRRKVRNLLADDRITVCVVPPDNLNRYVEVRGRAVLEPDDDRAFIDGIARRYMGADRYPFDAPDDERVTVTVVPEHVSCPQIPLADDPPFLHPRD